jgi:hypothetical protein
MSIRMKLSHFHTDATSLAKPHFHPREPHALTAGEPDHRFRLLFSQK